MGCEKGTKSVRVCNAFKHFLTNFRRQILRYNNYLSEKDINKLARLYFKKDESLLQKICPQPLRKRCSFRQKNMSAQIEHAKYHNDVAHLPILKSNVIGQINLKKRNEYLLQQYRESVMPQFNIRDYYKTLNSDIDSGEIEKEIKKIRTKTLPSAKTAQSRSRSPINIDLNNQSRFLNQNSLNNYSRLSNSSYIPNISNNFDVDGPSTSNYVPNNNSRNNKNQRRSAVLFNETMDLTLQSIKNTLPRNMSHNKTRYDDSIDETVLSIPLIEKRKSLTNNISSNMKSIAIKNNQINKIDEMIANQTKNLSTRKSQKMSPSPQFSNSSMECTLSPKNNRSQPRRKRDLTINMNETMNETILGPFANPNQFQTPPNLTQQSRKRLHRSRIPLLTSTPASSTIGTPISFVDKNIEQARFATKTVLKNRRKIPVAKKKIPSRNYIYQDKTLKNKTLQSTSQLIGKRNDTSGLTRQKLLLGYRNVE